VNGHSSYDISIYKINNGLTWIGLHPFNSELNLLHYICDLWILISWPIV